MEANLTMAATKALETLKKHNITATPIDPLYIVKHTPGVLVMPFAEMACNAGKERSSLVPMFGMNQDAVTFHIDSEKIKYVVAYNQFLPYDMTRRGLARELGHIIMGHDGTRPPEIRLDEAMAFAKHLLFPRPLIHAIQESDIPLTMEVFTSITGASDRCFACLKTMEGVHVSAELNRTIREQFANCIQNLIDFQMYLSKGDSSPLADFGTYMDGYEE